MEYSEGDEKLCLLTVPNFDLETLPSETDGLLVNNGLNEVDELAESIVMSRSAVVV